MSNYVPKRAPNVADYVANLNAIPTAHESPATDSFSDIDLFANAEFLNFDLGEPGEAVGVDFDRSEGALAQDDAAGGTDTGSELKHMNFEDGFPLNDMSFAPNSSHGSLPTLQSIEQGNQGFNYASPAAYSPITSQVPQTGEKRNLSQSTADALEQNSRAAAEEDKRRRNTAASARFRVKKKQREQALEKTAKEMGDKVENLETRIAELEKENQWLKSLVVEKSVNSKEEVAEMLQKFSEETRSTSTPKKGVGTFEVEGRAA